MGREIKFRCWFKNEMAEQMLYDERPGDCLVWKNQGQDIEAIMQFTGLHDKNGKEIYESDILKIPCDIPDSIHGNHSFHEVVYRNGTWINQYLKSETGFKLPRGYTAGVLIDNYEHQMKDLVFKDEYLTDTEIEVIGNIYDNKDLLS